MLTVGQARNKWKMATTFGAICELSAQFIEGKCPFFPGYGGSTLDQESDTIRPSLARINRLGFLSTLSQPGLRDSHYEQRAFVEGYVSKRQADRILLTLTSHEFLVQAFEPAKPNGIGKTICITRTLAGEEFTRAGFSNRINLKDAYTKSALSKKAQQCLSLAWFITIADLKWQRSEQLWQSLERTLSTS